MGELIAVLSGKGGTGKTSVCAGVATALAQMGEKVLCIDCDVGLRNLDIALGISELGTLSFTDVCQGGYSLDQAAQHPVFPNLSFLTAPMNCTADAVDQLAFAAMLEAARSRFSYILLDAPAGIEAGFTLAAKYADRVMLVTGADPAAIRDAGMNNSRGLFRSIPDCSDTKTDTDRTKDPLDKRSKNPSYRNKQRSPQIDNPV